MGEAPVDLGDLASMPRPAKVGHRRLMRSTPRHRRPRCSTCATTKSRRRSQQGLFTEYTNLASRGKPRRRRLGSRRGGPGRLRS
jgi:hypothetical protein